MALMDLFIDATATRLDMQEIKVNKSLGLSLAITAV